MRLLVQQRRIQVATGAPLTLGDVLQPRGHEHEGAPSVREGAHHAGSPADLAVEPLDGVVGPDPPPVLAGEARVCVSSSSFEQKGVVTEICTRRCRSSGCQAHRLPVFHGTQASERALSAACVVPLDIRVYRFLEVVERGG